MVESSDSLEFCCANDLNASDVISDESDRFLIYTIEELCLESNNKFPHIFKLFTLLCRAAHFEFSAFNFSSRFYCCQKL